MSEYLKNWVMAQYISKFINVYDEEKENDIISHGLKMSGANQKTFLNLKIIYIKK